MTEKQFKEEFLEEMNEIKKEKPERVTVDDIIGLVDCEPTDSVTLKKEAQLSICEKRLIELKEENEQLKSEIEKLSYANEDLLSEKRNWQIMSDEYCKLENIIIHLEEELNYYKTKSSSLETGYLEYQRKYHKVNNKLHSIEGIMEELSSEDYLTKKNTFIALNQIKEVMWNDFKAMQFL